MTTWAVIATGQSLTKKDVAYLEGKCQAVAVSNAFELVPWASLVVSHDRQWWKAHPEAMQHAGRKFCRFDHPGLECFRPDDLPQGSNSGLMGMIAARNFGASRILLLGFDMHGTHYFGAHVKEGLSNTTESRFNAHIRQFSRFSGAEVINCTLGSALPQFERQALREAI